MNSMDDINYEDIVKIKNEVKILLSEVEKKENILVEKVEKNTHDILIYKSYLEDIIEKYHLICKKIYS
jgi:hypothetical protein